MAIRDLKQQLENHPIVRRLLNNPNWEPAARAAIAEFVDGQECPIPSWRKSSTWKQVEMAKNQLEKSAEPGRGGSKGLLKP